MADLINDLSDPDTPKPSLDDLLSLSLTNIPVNVPEGVLHSKARPLSQRTVPATAG